MADIVATSVDKVTFDDSVSLSFEERWIFYLEGFFVFFSFVSRDDILRDNAVIYDDVVEFAWVDVSFYSICEVDNLHIGSLSTLGHGITDIYELGICLTQSLAHTDTEEIGHYGCKEVSRSDDDIICFEYSIFSIGIQISLFSYEPCIDDILVNIMRASEVIFI